ncbi:MAG: protein phosphatase 2C domain-containing protein [Candidatus Magnetobacterium sp. LHC-1]|uniref:Serine/threonine-protein phosphatase n=1 Tax=Candidatus Magnetobacterium casense TaxID=1455061 RepID=A0ABS6S0B7_9BACT|nr:protein phosphatase 2C domain-containing protein [Candidatus Magnetobacterium casensis]MBF0606648.1 serine/threonine-protein phosphatase [Nitrospirota bacterium]MBV6341829.1 serine/threonine-protein phosphatase [Candidatus Magnetobacterium casensis]
MWSAKGKTLRIEYGIKTHMGGRSENQDNWNAVIDEQNGRYCFVVADGLGGHKGGQIASQIAVNTVTDCFASINADNVSAELTNAMQAAHNAIRQRSNTDDRLRNMQSTCVVAVILGERMFWAYVGDSRIYVYRQGLPLYQSKDHSVVQLLLDMGEITAEAAKDHPDRNRVLKTLGMPDELRPAIHADGLTLQSGDYILLCTDGLWQYLTDSDMYNLHLRYANTSVQKITEAMVRDVAKTAQRTKENYDNITAQLIMVT